MEFNLFDFINIIVIGFSIFFGLYKGFIKSIISMLSFAMLACITIVLFSLLNPYISLYISKIVLANVISAISAFLIALVITSITYAKFMDFIKDIRGGAVDRLLGIIFGFVRGMLASVFLFALIVFFIAEDFMEYRTFREFAEDIDPAHFPSWMSEGVTYKMVFSTSIKIIEMIPKKYIDEIMDIEFVRIDKNKGVSNTLKPKPKPRVIHEDESEYFNG